MKKTYRAETPPDELPTPEPQPEPTPPSPEAPVPAGSNEPGVLPPSFAGTSYK